jgi:hypothetical protein
VIRLSQDDKAELRFAAMISRRRFLQTGSLAGTAYAMGMRIHPAWGAEGATTAPLAEFHYGDVSLASDAHESQLMNTC